MCVSELLQFSAMLHSLLVQSKQGFYGKSIHSSVIKVWKPLKSLSCKRLKAAKDLKEYGMKPSSSVLHQTWTQVPAAQQLVSVTMAEPAERSSTAGQRLGAPESFGVSTLEPGLRPPGQPPGRQVPIRVQMLDDTQEVFEIPVSNFFLFTHKDFSAEGLSDIYCII